jgi:hypothetical protein
VYAVTSAAIPQAMLVQQSERDHWEPQPFTRAAGPSKRSGSHCSPSGGSLRASAALLHASAISGLICITTASMLRRTITSRLHRADMHDRRRQGGRHRTLSEASPITVATRQRRAAPARTVTATDDTTGCHVTPGKPQRFAALSPSRSRQHHGADRRPTRQRRTRQRHHDASLWARVV